MRLLIAFLLCATATYAGPKKVLLHLAEHVTLGAGVEIATAQAAGGPSHVAVGMTSAAIVAGLKEYVDYQTGKDSKKMAFVHALEIVGGAGAAAQLNKQSPFHTEGSNHEKRNSGK
jgi:hypothetical protein